MPSYQPAYLVLQYDETGRVVQTRRILTLEKARELKAEWTTGNFWATYHFEE